jgi:hypothetical protein
MGRGTPGHSVRQPGHRHTRTRNEDLLRGPAAIPGQRLIKMNNQG